MREVTAPASLSSLKDPIMLARILVSSLLVAAPAVALASDVRVDFDRHKDFSKYRTFTVEVGPLVRTDGVVDEQNTLAETRLRQAVARELEARGLEPDDTGANLVVRVSGRDTERTQIINTGWNSYGGYWRSRHGYWGRRYGYWGMPYYGDVWTRRYVEGALTVDVIERDTGALVYRALVTDEVSKDLDKQVVKVMDRAFKKFPVRELED
jgi:hypothetical protein